MDQEMKTTYHDFLVVGGGPAGIQAGILLQNKNLDYLILERTNAVGAHWSNYPRHRSLISINKRFTGSDNAEFNLRHDWNSLLTTAESQKPFTEYTDELYPSADTLLQYLKDVVVNHDLNIKYETEVSYITKSKGLFRVSSGHEVFECKHLLLGMGGKPWFPNVPGIDLPEIDTYENVSLDKKLFENKRVLILGKGNSAFECGEYLANTASILHFVSPRQIQFAWNTHYVGDLRAVRNNLLDMYQLKSQHAILNGSITNIDYDPNCAEGRFKVDFAFSLTPEDPVSTIYYDNIIACTGFKYVDTSMFDPETIPVQIDERPALRGKFPKVDPDWQYAGVENMYAIGAPMQTVNFRKNAGGFIHGFRYTIKTLVDLIAEKSFDIPYPSTKLSNYNISDLADYMSSRMNSCSSIYQMYNELCDVIKYNRETDSFTYYKDYPLGLLSRKFRADEIVTFTFNFGCRGGEDAFTYVLEATPESPEKSIFIHPVIRSYDSSFGVKDELHLLENLESTWDDEELHLQPLRSMLRRSYKMHVVMAEQEQRTKAS